MPDPISIHELPPAARKAVNASLGRSRSPARRSFPADRVRTYALRAMATLAELTQDQRRRVLRHALKINEVNVV